MKNLIIVSFLILLCFITTNEAFAQVEISILPNASSANCNNETCFDNPNPTVIVGNSMILWNEDSESHLIVSGSPITGQDYVYEDILLNFNEGVEYSFDSIGSYSFFSIYYPWIFTTINVVSDNADSTNSFKILELSYLYKNPTSHFEMLLPPTWETTKMGFTSSYFDDIDNYAMKGWMTYLGEDEQFTTQSDSELQKWLVNYIETTCTANCQITNSIDEPTITNFEKNHKRLIGGVTANERFYDNVQEVIKMTTLHLINDEAWIIDLTILNSAPESYHTDLFLDILANFEPLPTSKNYIDFEEAQSAKTIPPQPTPQTSSDIPSWIKNNAGWWAEGAIDDNSFIQGIQYLIKEGIMEIPPTSVSTSSNSADIPSWIKNNAGWWAEGAIDDNSFIQGIQYLIKEGILSVEDPQSTPTTESQPVPVPDKQVEQKTYLNHVFSNSDGSKAYATFAKWSIIPSDTKKFFKVIIQGDVKLEQELERSEWILADMEDFRLVLNDEVYRLNPVIQYEDTVGSISSVIEFDWKSDVSKEQKFVLVAEMKNIDTDTPISLYYYPTWYGSPIKSKINEIGSLQNVSYHDICSNQNSMKFCNEFFSLNSVEILNGNQKDLLIIELEDLKSNTLRELSVKTDSNTYSMDKYDMIPLSELQKEGFITQYDNTCESETDFTKMMECVKKNQYYYNNSSPCSAKSDYGVTYCFLIEKSDDQFRVYNESSYGSYKEFALLFDRDFVN